MGDSSEEDHLPHFDIFTYGELDSVSSRAVIAVYFAARHYGDHDISELVPTDIGPVTTAAAGYWAIARALTRAPAAANIVIYSQIEACVQNLLLCIKTCSTYHDHSQRKLVERILNNLRARKKAGGSVKFKFVDTDLTPSHSNTKLARRLACLDIARQLARITLRDAIEKSDKAQEENASDNQGEEDNEDGAIDLLSCASTSTYT
ncbi:hypothetical protein BDZ90DRAFT_275731 [Jaminaea rosea]|uniref:RNase H type-1 domain-containing protein n=1 Tax=Jaminaea rosea TaxID=1569628 RepID=A0A316UNF2_9BASI|nr:hypothetical protein BDZ90DRAFT_275731 [Jaminaea rosea]PWN25891.1 hypothetical protein BDZ90DRAFT_275731 [Jaminaea rosea]